ncbi:hypothetical protein YC2023_087248 [Brassica napus]
MQPSKRQKPHETRDSLVRILRHKVRLLPPQHSLPLPHLLPLVFIELSRSVSGWFDRYNIQPKVKNSFSDHVSLLQRRHEDVHPRRCPLTTRFLSFDPGNKGYDFPWTLTNYIPFYGGAEYHDYHHYVGGQSQSNFASVFTYCDYIYGTDKGYRLQKKLLQQIKEDSKKSNKQNGEEKLD